MAAGTAQINAFADFLQEKEDDMKTVKPYFEGEGYNLDYVIPMHPAGDEFDDYDYSKPVEYDYSKNEETEQLPIAQSPEALYSAESPGRM